jgi:hypothetical protein
VLAICFFFRDELKPVVGNGTSWEKALFRRTNARVSFTAMETQMQNNIVEMCIVYIALDIK